MTTLPLARDPGRTPTLRLLGRFIAMDARLAWRRWRGRSRPAVGPLDDSRPPDSPLARDALELARELCAPFLLNHCMRSYQFGHALGRLDGMRFDRELLFVAAVLHDLGLSERHRDEPGSFEYVGAQVAHAFCRSRGVPESKAALVHDAVALHAAVGLAHLREPEVALVHYGAGADVIGLRVSELPSGLVAALVRDYPRLHFKALFGDVIRYQAERKPGCHIAGHYRLGFTKRVASAPFAD